MRNTDWQNPQGACASQIARALGDEAEQRLGGFDADRAARVLMGDTLFVNPMLMGYAWQRGWIPLSLPALMRAMALNGVAVQANQTAFAWGRQAAARPQALAQWLNQLDGKHSAGSAQVIHFQPRETLAQIVQRRTDFLRGYQNAAYAEQYRQFVERVQQAEGAALPGKTQLTEAVARYLFKLMAYKDEYEVARLHSDPAFLQRIADMFEGDYKLHFHLAPPLMAKRNDKGELVKQKYGPGMMGKFRLLAKLKGLRGTWLDVFARTEERRTERALITRYRQSIEAMLPALSEANHGLAVEIARIPEQIRGYGHVKERYLKTALARWDELSAHWPQGLEAAPQARAA